MAKEERTPYLRGEPEAVERRLTGMALAMDRAMAEGKFTGMDPEDPAWAARHAEILDEYFADDPDWRYDREEILPTIRRLGLKIHDGRGGEQ